MDRILANLVVLNHIPTVMQRRSFIKNAGFTAIALSTTGLIHFDGDKYVGDCETTTDIIGPFYRPDSPVRNNFIVPGDPGIPVELSGTVRHNDCTTPYKKAKIELWHCANNGLYDNTTAEYRYRGTTFTDDKGHYSFETILPVPYNAAGGPMRPAHFHLMITAEGYQPLITQLYFVGDPYLDKDPFSKAATAKKRILKVQVGPSGKKKVLYDIILAEKPDLEPAALDALAGNYVCEDDGSITCEFFIRNKRLWHNTVYGKKLDPYGRPLDYIGDNKFQSPAQPPPMNSVYVFETKPSGAIKCTQTVTRENGKQYVLVYNKA